MIDIDCSTYLRLTSDEELIPFLSRGWREYILPARTAGGPPRKVPALLPTLHHENPEGERLAVARSGAAADGVAAMIQQRPAWSALVTPDAGLRVGVIAHHGFAVAMAQAVNDWLADWMTKVGAGVRGMITIPSQVPEEAAAEIRRVGRDSRFVAVLLGGNGLAKPFGHPVYAPIHRAAAEMGLGLAINIGSEAAPNTLSHPVGGGFAASFIEYYILRSQPILTHLTSLIGQAIFEKFPGIRGVIASGAGVGWLHAWLWRFDAEYKSFGLGEAPWMTTTPSDYARRYVGISTYGVDPSGLSELEQIALSTIDGVEDVICYGSGYPNWDRNDPDRMIRTVPESWRPKFLGENVKRLVRWAEA